MKYKRRVRWLVVLIALFLIVPTYLTVTVRHVHATGPQPYYIDSYDGNDNYSGTSKDSPWQSFANVNSHTFQPGDSINLEDGDSWSPTPLGEVLLHPLGSGDSINGPITITSYRGDQGASAPILNGQGDPAVVELSNQHDWTINGLEITNWPTYSDCQTEPPSGLNAHCYDFRSGVLIYAKDPGLALTLTTLNNITLQSLNVHHVLGQWGRNSTIQPDLDKNNLTGGIVFDIEKNGSGDTSYTAWSNAQVLSNTISDVWRAGIVFHSQWGGDTFPGQHCQQLYDENNGWASNQPSTGIYVFQNRLWDVGGTGIVVGVSSQATISANTLAQGDQDHGGAVAGMWTFDSSAATVESNIVTGMADSSSGAQAYDTDYCEYGDQVEYNFSYSNPSGFLLAMPQRTNNVIRYNISQDDGGGYSYFLTNWSPLQNDGTMADNDQIYNNTVYVPGGSHNKGLVSNPNEPWTTPVNPPPVFDNNVLDVLLSAPNGNGDPPPCAIPGSWTQVSLNTFNGTVCGNPAPAGNQHNDPAFLYPGLGGYDGFGSSCQPPSCYPPQTAYYYATQAPAPSPLICYSAFVSGQKDDGGRDYNVVTLPPDAPPYKIDGGALEVSNGIC